MPRQFASRSKTQIAVLAREGKIRLVGNLVPFQTLLVGKGLRAFLALEGSFLFVKLHVFLQLFVG